MIIDCFIFYNEIDLLKFRLEYLYNVVDYFVLVESTTTFAGNKKKLYFDENKYLFNKYVDKIVHIIDNKEINVSNPWLREYKQRNSITLGLQKLNLTSNDIILISDVDEIPNKKTLLEQSNYIANAKKILSFEQDLYYYNLTNKSKKKWYFAKCLNYYVFQNHNCLPQEIRSSNNVTKILNGGWHFSYFGSTDFIINKIKNFSHQEYNKPQFLSKDKIEFNIKNNIDLFNRNTIEWFHIPINENSNLPDNYESLLSFNKL